MPKIILKHKSPEYADSATETTYHECDMPGCTSHADNKAPKHRGLDDYYHFCVDHIREYNKAWDFFSGMSETEIQSHVESSFYGDRPTWIYNGDNTAEDELRQSAEKTYAYGDEQTQNQSKQKQTPPQDNHTAPEHEAMAIMGLAPPVTLEEIKTRYKILAKKHHPDLNRDDPNAEELLKKINMAYTILKLAFEEYRKLPDHKF
ncbi:MAG: J domain-containing protein [Alphaproteobacteria bacterium]